MSLADWIKGERKSVEEHREAIRLHWEAEDAAAQKAERTRNLSVLTAACLEAMTMAGLYSMAIGDQAVEAAEAILDRIERGPEPPQPEEVQP